MEPPAVTSCSSLSQQHSVSSEKNRRDMGGVEFLHIDPNLTFNSMNRHFEELPENFLETISPQQGTPTMSLGLSSQDGNSLGPQLASLTPMSVAGGNDHGGYATLVPMPAPSHYTSSLKMESLDHLSSQLHSIHPSPLDKSFGSGPAGLLSPLLDNTREQSAMGLIGMHRANGRASDMLSNLRRPVSYIKEEINSDMTFQSAQDYDTSFVMHQPSQQELERMTAETPPAISNVDVASSILASLAGETTSSITPQQFISPTQQSTSRNGRSQATPRNRSKMDSNSEASGTKTDFSGAGRSSGAAARNRNSASVTLPPGAGVPRATYSTTDMTDPLNAEIDDAIYIDTKDLCKRVAYELKQHSIPQAVFAERILCRSQGTLSDLLRNPKPWNRLKSGRETFRRMYNWIQQPLHIRLSILDMYKGPMGSATTSTNTLPPPTPAQNARHGTRIRSSGSGDENGQGGNSKRPRLVFTDIQKRTLQAIFKETQRPSREMQQTIAEHLRLDMSTVSNFFMNARRRSRNGSSIGDEPAPYQQVRTITPPPDSPPQRPNGARVRTYKTSSSNSQIPDHIEETVAAVAERAAHYSEEMGHDFLSSDDANLLMNDDPAIWSSNDNGETTSSINMNQVPSPKNVTSSTRTIPISDNKTIQVKVERETSSTSSADAAVASPEYVATSSVSSAPASIDANAS
uniref:One cut domain family member n=1 Tax=Acrobeloides nanus TaxID=290746 RepID=A0A914EPY1_9BILA